MQEQQAEPVMARNFWNVDIGDLVRQPVRCSREPHWLRPTVATTEPSHGQRNHGRKTERKHHGARGAKVRQLLPHLVPEGMAEARYGPAHASE